MTDGFANAVATQCRGRQADATRIADPRDLELHGCHVLTVRTSDDGPKLGCGSGKRIFLIGGEVVEHNRPVLEALGTSPIRSDRWARAASLGGQDMAAVTKRQESWAGVQVHRQA